MLKKLTNFERLSALCEQGSEATAGLCAALAQPGGRSLNHSRGRLASCLELANRSASEQQSKVVCPSKATLRNPPTLGDELS
jgi:hypothetical protein